MEIDYFSIYGFETVDYFVTVDADLVKVDYFFNVNIIDFL
jgi:hypothetical protein